MAGSLPMHVSASSSSSNGSSQWSSASEVCSLSTAVQWDTAATAVGSQMTARIQAVCLSVCLSVCLCVCALLWLKMVRQIEKGGKTVFQQEIQPQLTGCTVVDCYCSFACRMTALLTISHRRHRRLNPGQTLGVGTLGASKVCVCVCVLLRKASR